MEKKPALHIDAVSKIYGGKVKALKSITLTVQPGDFFALLGPNGAGKSTLIGILSSLVNKTSGRVEVFGVDIDQNFPLAKQHLGVVPQEFNFNQFEKVKDVLIFQAGFYGIPRRAAESRAQELLELLGLWEKRNTPSRSLSGGMKRRLMIGRALMHKPRLLILDEPTAGVDIELRRSMWKVMQELNSQGTTIILTTHYLEEAETLCRNIAIIDRGELVANSSMKSLLARLDHEEYLLDLAKSHHFEVLPEVPHGQLLQMDENTLALSVRKASSLNDVFSVLTACGIQITSFKNKTNRLEELFVSLTQGGKTA
ncbi:MAG: ABC transporter ATP-binding protein [Pseudomonadota bacterium]